MTDYTKLVKALACGNDGKLPCHNDECPYWVDKWHGIGLCNVIKKDADAAAAIEELQAEVERLEPKRGEWIIHGEPPMLVIECSVCGQKYFNHVMQEKAKYCSMCGAKMEVQDETEI